MTELGFCVWLTGLPSSGKTSIAWELAPLLLARGWKTEVLDGDEPKRVVGVERPGGVSSPGMVPEILTFVAKILVRNGLVPIVSAQSLHLSSRTWARIQIRRFVEVFVNTPLEVCELRGTKGTAPTSRTEWLPTNFNDAYGYEAPRTPEITVGTLDRTPVQSALWVVRELQRLGWTPPQGVGALEVPTPFAPRRVGRAHRRPAY